MNPQDRHYWLAYFSAEELANIHTMQLREAAHADVNGDHRRADELLFVASEMRAAMAIRRTEKILAAWQDAITGEQHA